MVQGPKGQLQIPYIVAGAGGYTNLGKLQLVNGAYPIAPLALGSGLSLECYDQNNFGFLRLAVSKTQLVGTYISAPYSGNPTPAASVVETFTVDLVKHTVSTGSSGGGKKPKRPKKPGQGKKKRR